MSPQEQRVAIAEACGWKKEGSLWICPVTKRGWATDYPPPNYPADLNAMHEAENVLDSTNGGIKSPDCLRYAYAGNLYRIVPEDMQPARATAAQRAEAFLRTLGKWKE